MARYIDADIVLDRLPNDLPYKASVKRVLMSAPAVDAVEVVRCKDCDVPHNKWLGCPHLNGLIPPPDFYCAKGTPKERGGE